MGDLKYWAFVFTLFSAACGTTQTPKAHETLLPSTVTTQIVEVTRIVTLEQTVIITTTPIPLLAQECLNTAMTQGELNSCAALESELAKAEMEKLILQIDFSSEKERQEFVELQNEWEIQIIENCEFLFAQVVTDDNGNIFYKGGSIAPMQRNFCLAEQYKRRTEDLRIAYHVQ